MDDKFLGLIIGGIIPSILFGLTGVFQKMSTNQGIALGPYLTIIGVAVTVVGVITWAITKEHTVNLQSGGYALLLGVIWAASTLLIALALSRYGANVSQLVPLYNTNSLVAVLLGLIFLDEAASVRTSYLLPGVVAIVIGGYLCSKA